LLSPDVWKLNGAAPDLSVFEDSPVHVGLDLSPRQDGSRPQFLAAGEILGMACHHRLTSLSTSATLVRNEDPSFEQASEPGTR
jgi:hypothetical protein